MLKRKVVRGRCDKEKPQTQYMAVMQPAPPAAAQDEPSSGLVAEIELEAHALHLPDALRAEADETLAALREYQGCASLEAAVAVMDQGSAPSYVALAAVAERARGEAEFAEMLLCEAADMGSVCAQVEQAARRFPSPEALAALDAPNVRQHPRAQYLIASALEDGLCGVKADAELALKWLERSAAGGYPPATFTLGLRCEQAKDIKGAYRHYTHGAERGHVDSQLSLGKLFLLGVDLLAAQSAAEARLKADRWLRRAAAAGSTEASYLLSRAAHTAQLTPREPGSPQHAVEQRHHPAPLTPPSRRHPHVTPPVACS